MSQFFSVFVTETARRTRENQHLRSRIAHSTLSTQQRVPPLEQSHSFYPCDLRNDIGGNLHRLLQFGQFLLHLLGILPPMLVFQRANVWEALLSVS